MQRLILVATVVLGLVVGGWVVVQSAPTASVAQDRTEERLSALETQAADLTTRVADLEAATANDRSPTQRTAEPTETHDLTGTIELHDGDYIFAGDSCSGRGGYSDVHIGAQVKVSDAGGRVLALGSLTTSEVVTSHICVFTFEVLDVPRSDFYVIEVANRDAPTYSHADLDAAGWHIDLSIGD